MAKPVWDAYVELNGDFGDVFFDVFMNGGFAKAATTSRFTLVHYGNKIVFDGTFTLKNGHVTGGTVTGFHVISEGKELLTAKGHAFSVAELGLAVADMQAPGGSIIGLYYLLLSKGVDMRDHAGSAFLDGSPFADILRGLGGDDHIQGYDGNDRLLGGSGGDNLEGGKGNDKLYGGAGKDTLYGEDNNDRLDGGTGNDTLYGNDGKDRLIGGDGNDRLDGGAGDDILTGGKGKDVFVFGDALDKAGVDHITDFASGIDRIELSASVFNLPAGALAKAAFFVGAAAHDADDRIIYNKATGALFYDADGQGGVGQVKIAVLDGHPTLKFSDIVVA